MKESRHTGSSLVLLVDHLIVKESRHTGSSLVLLVDHLIVKGVKAHWK